MPWGPRALDCKMFNMLFWEVFGSDRYKIFVFEKVFTTSSRKHVFFDIISFVLKIISISVPDTQFMTSVRKRTQLLVGIQLTGNPPTSLSFSDFSWSFKFNLIRCIQTKMNQLFLSQAQEVSIRWVPFILIFI